MFTLSQLLEGMGQVEEAGSLLQQALDQYESRNGADDPDTLDVLDGLARHKLFAGRIDEAVELARESAAARSCIFGPKDPRTLESLGFIAYVESAKRPDDSLDQLEMLRTTSLSELGPEHATTLMLSRFLTGVLVQQRRNQEAQPELVAAMAQMIRRPGPPTIADTNLLFTLGQVEWSLGRQEVGLGLLEEVIASAKLDSDVSAPNLFFFAGEACGMYEKLERFDEALQLSWDRLALLPPDHPGRAKVEADILRLEAAIQER
jgi:tetratricopeptide (TPR) repeat protein